MSLAPLNFAFPQIELSGVLTKENWEAFKETGVEAVSDLVQTQVLPRLFTRNFFLGSLAGVFSSTFIRSAGTYLTQDESLLSEVLIKSVSQSTQTISYLVSGGATAKAVNFLFRNKGVAIVASKIFGRYAELVFREVGTNLVSNPLAQTLGYFMGLPSFPFSFKDGAFFAFSGSLGAIREAHVARGWKGIVGEGAHRVVDTVFQNGLNGRITSVADLIRSTKSAFQGMMGGTHQAMGLSNRPEHSSMPEGLTNALRHPVTQVVGTAAKAGAATVVGAFGLGLGVVHRKAGQVRFNKLIKNSKNELTSTEWDRFLNGEHPVWETLHSELQKHGVDPEAGVIVSAHRVSDGGYKSLVFNSLDSKRYPTSPNAICFDMKYDATSKKWEVRFTNQRGIQANASTLLQNSNLKIRKKDRNLLSVSVIRHELDITSPKTNRVIISTNLGHELSSLIKQVRTITGKPGMPQKWFLIVDECHNRTTFTPDLEKPQDCTHLKIDGAKLKLYYHPTQTRNILVETMKREGVGLEKIIPLNLPDRLATALIPIVRRKKRPPLIRSDEQEQLAQRIRSIPLHTFPPGKVRVVLGYGKQFGHVTLRCRPGDEVDARIGRHRAYLTIEVSPNNVATLCDIKLGNRTHLGHMGLILAFTDNPNLGLPEEMRLIADNIRARHSKYGEVLRDLMTAFRRQEVGVVKDHFNPTYNPLDLTGLDDITRQHGVIYLENNAEGLSVGPIRKMGHLGASSGVKLVHIGGQIYAISFGDETLHTQVLELGFAVDGSSNLTALTIGEDLYKIIGDPRVKNLVVGKIQEKGELVLTAGVGGLEGTALETDSTGSTDDVQHKVVKGLVLTDKIKFADWLIRVRPEKRESIGFAILNRSVGHVDRVELVDEKILNPSCGALRESLIRNRYLVSID